MWKRALSLYLPQRRLILSFFSSSEAETPSSLYSFLQPSLFSHPKNTPSSPPPRPPPSQPQTLTQELKTALESALHKSVLAHNADDAWKAFKALTSHSSFPSKPLANSLISHLSSFADTHNLKRAFPSAVYFIEKDPGLVDFGTISALLEPMRRAGAVAPAFARVRSMFKHRYFMPFELWGNLLVEICRENEQFVGFLRVFEESYRVALDEKLDFMRPDLAACNAALEGCCRHLKSVTDAEKVVETMSVLRVRPNESSFGFLAYLYALKGLEERFRSWRI